MELDEAGVSGLILAGGQGKRMGKKDKGLTNMGDRPLVAYVIDALSPQVDAIYISANQNIEEYRKFGYEVYEDYLVDKVLKYAGPLAGLHRVLLLASKNTDNNELIVVAPCDAPLLPGDLVDRLLKAYNSSKGLAVIPHDGIRMQPLFGLYSTKALPSLEDYISSGQRKVGTWVESLSPQMADFSDEADAFLNINSPDDLARAKTILNS